jgi:hypothetical protein
VISLILWLLSKRLKKSLAAAHALTDSREGLTLPAD